ncbi:hypothetical protein [Williamsia sterculiae]|nr:hypothetical protein [Williamsia sterculiae]
MPPIKGDLGQPRRKVFYKVGHKAVLIDLGALYPRVAHHSGRYHPKGLQVDKVVTGVLTGWHLSEWGHWYGRVTYTVAAGVWEEQVTHWVPAWVLRPVKDTHG